MWKRIKKNPKLALAFLVAMPGSGFFLFALGLVFWKLWPFLLVAALMGGFIWGLATIFDEFF